MGDYLQPALPTYSGQGWLFNSIDYQILSKSDGWNQDQTKRLIEYQEGINKGMRYVALAVPYENLSKYEDYVADARTKGLKIWHRSHWNAWQGDNGVGDIATPTSLTRSGSTATCVTNTAHGMQTGDTVSMNGMDQTDYRGEFTITVTNSTTFTYTVANAPATPATGNIGWRYGRSTYIRKTMAFITDNPGLFEPGDIFGMCVEADQADSSNMTFKTPGTTNFNTAIYNQFQKDQVFYANEAFTTAGITGIYTWGISQQLSNVNLNGQTLDSGSTGNASGLGDADITSYFGGVLTFDHYCSDAYTDPTVYAAAYSADLDAVHAAFPNARLMIGEWGWRTIMPASEAEQQAVYEAVVDVLLTKDYIIGVNFWNHLGQTQSSLWNDVSGTIVAGGRPATAEVLRAFTTALSYFETAPPPPANFLRCVGTHFELDGEVFVPFGASTYDISFNGINQATADDKINAALDLNLNMIRIINFFGGNGITDEGNWQQADYILNECRKKGLKVLLDLSDYTRVLANSGHDFQDQPVGEYIGLWNTFLTRVFTRINTINGLAYKDDDAIGIVSISGEVGYVVGRTDGTFLHDWFAGTSAHIKTIDQNHIIHAGGQIPEIILSTSYTTSFGAQQDMLSIPTIDCVSTHPYYTQQNMSDLFPLLQAYAEEKQKPWFIEEFGYRQNVPGYTDSNRAQQFKFVYDIGRENGCAGFLFWNIDPGVGAGYGVSRLTPITQRMIKDYGITFSSPSPYVKRVGSDFVHKHERFRFVGFNNYTMVINSQSQATLATTFNAAKRHGCSVFRTWCFDIGKPPTNNPGNFRYQTTAAIGSNILPNGDFETNTTGWSLDGNFTRSTADAFSGTASIAQSSAGGFQNFTTLNTVAGIDVSPNTVYTLRFRYKLAVSGQGPVVNVNVGSTFGSSIGFASLGSTGGNWSQGSLTFNTGNNSKIWIRIFNNNGTVNGFYDDFTLGTGGNTVLAWREATLQQLDLVLDEARKRGVKLQLCLADNTPNYNTKQTYVNWANAVHSAGISNAFPYIGFFSNTHAKQLFKDFVLGLVSRVNTINGRLYKDDDTIFSWELGNELRTDAFEGANVNTLASENLALLSKPGGWIDEMSTYIKSIDPNHLVSFSSGSHGWQYATDPGNFQDSVWNGTFYGVDYEIIANLPNIDFLDCHAYPTQGTGETDILNYGYKLGFTRATRGQGFRAQLRDYVAKAKAAGKPFVLGEVGFIREAVGSNDQFPLYPRHNAFYAIFDEVFNNDGDGILIWSATVTGGGSYSVGMDEVGRASYWGNNENSNDSTLMHKINALNTTLVASGMRARAV